MDSLCKNWQNFKNLTAFIAYLDISTTKLLKTHIHIETEVSSGLWVALDLWLLHWLFWSFAKWDLYCTWLLPPFKCWWNLGSRLLGASTNTLLIAFRRCDVAASKTWACRRTWRRTWNRKFGAKIKNNSCLLYRQNSSSFFGQFLSSLWMTIEHAKMGVF